MNTVRNQISQKSRHLVLQPAQILTLSRPSDGVSIRLNVQSGVLRLSSTATDQSEEITLALSSRYEQGRFQHPGDFNLQVEALTEARFWIEYHHMGSVPERDFLSDWILHLHWVRHPVKTEVRLMRLFQLMCQRLGKRTMDGYLIEFLLPHIRIAEIVGATRSTVSRTIGTLKRSGLIIINDEEKQLTLPISTD